MKSDNLLAGGERGAASPSLTQPGYHGGWGLYWQELRFPCQGRGGAAASLLTRSSKGGPLDRSSGSLTEDSGLPTCGLTGLRGACVSQEQQLRVPRVTREISHDAIGG